MRGTFSLVLLLSSLTALPALGGPLRFHCPFDGTCTAAVSPAAFEPVVRNGPAVFAEGVRGQAVVVGGKKGASILFRGSDYILPSQGTVSFWTKTVDWDANEQVGTTFFTVQPNVFLYKYPGFEDTVSFYCKFPLYDRYILYSAPLPLRRDKWVHVAVTWLDRVLCLYADGELLAAHLLLEPMEAGVHDRDLVFGTSSERKTLIDEFMVFDYPLARTEVAALAASYRGTAGPSVPADRPARLFAVHYPGVRRVECTADVRGASWAASAVRAEIEAIGSDGRRVPLGTVSSFAGGRAAAMLEVPRTVADGPVRLSARIRDGKGALLDSPASEPFEKRTYPWDGAAIGVSDDVIEPFTPLRVDNRSVFCWGREYRFSEEGWPERLVTRDEQILAAPIRLTASAGGAPVAWSGGRFAFDRRTPGVVEFTSRSQGPGLRLDVRGKMEYDGAVIYTATVTPSGVRTLDGLCLSIHLKDTNARLYHVCRDAIRQTNEADYVPAGTGTVWGSGRMKSRSVLGTFVPYFWLGDYDRGVCWMADSDRGWAVPDDKDCVEFERNGGVLTARIHFIRTETTLAAPWRTEFILMAGPARPEPEGWRMDPRGSSWFSGHTPSLQGYGRPPYMEKYVADVALYKKTHGFWGVNTSPNDFWGITPENLHHQLEWRGGGSWGYPLVQRNDFVMHTLDEFMKKGYIDGLYSDDVYPQVSYNLVTGRAYRRPDGRLQPGYSNFALRDFYKRAAYLFRSHKCSRRMMVHMTDSMVMPCYSFWDIKHDNEWDRTHNAIENYPLGEVCARSMSRQYGMAASWHTQADWVSDPETGGDDLAALLLLHDIMGRAENMANRTLPAKTLFGLGAGDVEFMGYWTLQPENDPRTKNVKASAWLRRSEGTALVVVANLDGKDRRETVRLPLERMGVRGPAAVCDGEERRLSIPLDGDAVTLSVPAHDFRLLLVGPSGRFPADLPAPGAALDLPAAPARDVCDAFDGPLGPAWKPVSSKESGGRIRTYRGRLMVLGSDYRFAAAERPFGLENATVGVRVETRGRAHQHWVGLALMWENGSFVFAGPHLNKGQFLGAVRAGGKTTTTWGGPVGLDAPEAMHQPNWVRIDLAPGTISFWSSADGTAWRKDSEVPRTADLKGAPAALRLGKSPTGVEAVHRPAPTPCFFDDLRVGRL